ncbi:MAG TPA: CvpA family protein [Gammaproteobacteria bacterium]|nr:CvpA family protein [Gammaproteobacteria bacterium]
MTFNWVDYTLLAIFFISTVSGLLRGGAREVISLVTWIAAFIVAGLFSRPVALAFASTESAQSTVTTAAATAGEPSMLALGVSFSVLFLLTLLAGSLIGYFVNRVVEGDGISFFNRFFGAVFGLARGYLVNLLIVFIGQLSPMAEQPYWMESSLVKSFQPTVQWLGSKVQPDVESLKSKVGQTLEKITTGVQNSMAGEKKPATN